MIADRNRIYDGWINLEAGVDAGRAPQMIDINQVVSAQNLTFRGGDISTRPGFRKIDETFPDFSDQTFCYKFNQNFAGVLHIAGEYAEFNINFPPPAPPPTPTPAVFVNENSEYIYKNGIFQCAIAYSPHFGEDCIMAMIGGRLFKITPLEHTAKVIEVVPETDVEVPSTFPMGEPRKPAFRNNKDFTIAYMVQADKWLVVQDGESKPILFDAANCRRAKTVSKRDQTEVPVGTMMAYGMGRICVVVNKRDVAFGDLYGSHDLPDPADSLILFTERNFLSEGFDAAIPFQQGIATGIVFFPQLDTSTGNGQLLVFAERGAASFHLSLPRDFWKTSSFQILALLTTGLRGHRSIAVVNEDLWFRSDDGVRSFRQARSEASGWAHIPLSTNVRQYMENDSQWMLKYASSIYFDNRIMTTVTPVPNQGRPHHNGMVVVDFDVVSSFGNAIKPCWDGHWKFPSDIKVLQMLTGQFNGVTRAFAFCLDENNENQLFEISKKEVNDWDEQRIEWEFVTRSMDFSRISKESSPFNEVELYDGDIWLTGIAE